MNAAPEKYQHVIRQAIEGTEVADDLICHGKTVLEHDQRLHKLLTKLEEKIWLWTVRSVPSEWIKIIVFMGILLSQHGVGPMEGKVRAVKEASHPITLSEVRSFLGLVGFSSTFIPDFATIAEPLRALTTNGVKFEWIEVQDKSFQTLKEQLTEVSILVHFNMTTNTRVSADASPVGLGAVLVQRVNGQSSTVCYAGVLVM